MNCPNCGASLEANARLCPNCGAVPTVWPPPPNFTPPMPLAHPKTLTGRVWTDFLLGAVMQCAAHLATARVLIRYVPLTSNSPDWITRATTPGSFVLCEMFWAIAFGLVIYYGLRRAYPFVTRGSGYATLALLVVLLGAFFTCRPLLY